MTRIEAPDIDCPKCNEPNAFGTLNPHYREALWQGSWGGVLGWLCVRCGYELLTSAADAKPITSLPEPPYNPPATPIEYSETSWLRRLAKLGLR